MVKNYLIEPPKNLLAKIILRIKREQRLMTIKKRLVIFSLTTALSAVVFVFVLNMTGAKISDSGFLQYLSLLFSDFSVVISNWESFVLTLLESLPAMSLALVFVTAFALLESIKFLVRDINNIAKKSLLINA